MGWVLRYTRRKIQAFPKSQPAKLWTEIPTNRISQSIRLSPYFPFDPEKTRDLHSCGIHRTSRSFFQWDRSPKIGQAVLISLPGEVCPIWKTRPGYSPALPIVRLKLFYVKESRYRRLT